MKKIDYTKFIKTIVIGIRYEKAFKLIDFSGEIVDRILRGAKSPFNTEYFTRYQDINKEVTLFNENSSSIFKINPQDIIFVHETTPSTFKSDLKWIENKVIDFIINSIFLKFNIENIIRIGIVYNNEIENIDIPFKKFMNIPNINNENISNFNINFSEKILPPVQEFKKLDDYKNIIYSFRKKDKLELSFDYQYFYLPHMKSMRDTNFKNWFKETSRYYFDEYYSLLAKLFEDHE
jgi:hypothetical protein